MAKILPLPVKKNKFGQLVADIPVTDYYAQIFEEVFEAYKAANNAEILKVMTSEGCGQCAEFIQTNEPEELADIITCCVTRLDILGDTYINGVIDLPKDFYRKLVKSVLSTLRVAVMVDFMYFSTRAEAQKLSIIINLCIARLEYLGYDESARQKLYAAVNEKNRKRGYFEE